MAFNDYNFFSYVFLATAVILFAGPAHAALCDNAPDKQFCISVIADRTDSRDAVVASMNKLVSQTKAGEVEVRKYDKMLGTFRCIKAFDAAILDGEGALKSLKKNDLPALKNFIASTRNEFDTCNKAFQGYGETNPIPQTTKLLDDIAIVSLYLANLV